MIRSISPRQLSNDETNTRRSDRRPGLAAGPAAVPAENEWMPWAQ